MEELDMNDKNVEKWKNEEGMLHREDGPALLFNNGSEVWFRNGILHRIDGPAMISKKPYYQKWYCNGFLHRNDGPAISTSELECWYKYGLLHREDGPAIVYFTGECHWYRYGQKIMKMDMGNMEEIFYE